MRIAYLHCFSGIGGDMLLGALVDAGVDPALFERTVRALDVGATVEVARVDRSGIAATKVEVRTPGDEHAHPHDAAVHGREHGPGAHGHGHEHDHGHEDEHGHEHARGPSHGDPPGQGRGGAHEPHAHPHGHEHGHGHGAHGRSLSAIRELIGRAPIEEDARRIALRAFELLGEAEAGIHGVPVERIHFHEVGAVDAIVDIVCGAVGCHALGVERWVCSPLNVGGGMVRCAHGVFPVPAPATLRLLEGAPVYAAGVEAELVTPTGAALVRALGCHFAPLPAMTVERTGYGAGTRDPKGWPNVLRLVLGEAAAREDEAADRERITVLETALDDLTPQVIGYVTERALALGALDVYASPLQMKKNRPGTLLTVLCRPADEAALRGLLFRETSTLGVRVRAEEREVLAREFVRVETPWGAVPVKVARRNGAVAGATPEYEDCRRVALAHGVPLKEVQRAALERLAHPSSSVPEEPAER